MPFKEATFWYGTILFTTGIYFWIQGGPSMTMSIILTVIGLAMSVYAVIAEHYPIPKLRLWVGLSLLTWALLGYDVYGHRAGLTLKAAPVLVLVGGISALILVSVILNRTKSKEPPLVTEAPFERPKEPSKPSKLVILSADYCAWNGAGENFDVTEFMRKIITGNSLVHGPIENDSFTVDGKNYVPRDPLFGKPKRLQVTYSYDGEKERTVRRTEHGRLTLPEDSGIDWLGSELNKAQAEIGKAKSRDYPRKIFTLEKAWPEGPATSSTVFLKNKVRMILTNHSDKSVRVWTPLWDSTEVQAEGSPPGSTIQLAKRGWEFDEWEEPERICVTVPIGCSFRTYIALRPAMGRSISERMRTGDWIGTALLPTKIDGKLYEIPIEIGKKSNPS